MNRLRRRQIAVLFAYLTLMALAAGGYAFAIQSDLVLLLALVPLFGVMALVFAISARE